MTCWTWAWGKQFELGCIKHPRFMPGSLESGCKSFREQISAFTSLCLEYRDQLARHLAPVGLLLQEYARFPAVSLLLFAPSHHYIATNFNANTIQLSLWPWAAFFFVRSLQTNSWKDGVFFGALGGCALLGKYYSVLFLASCFVAALLHPNRRPYFRSPAPPTALLSHAPSFCSTCMVGLNGLSTVQYALSKSQRPAGQYLYSAVGTVWRASRQRQPAR